MRSRQGLVHRVLGLVHQTQAGHTLGGGTTVKDMVSSSTPPRTMDPRPLREHLWPWGKWGLTGR
eukprot:1925290-Prorocentrum_lima.AAC.1